MNNIKFGHELPDWKQGMVAQAGASPEAQVSYLLRCLQIQSEQIQTLRLQFKTELLQRQIDKIELDKAIVSLERTRDYVKNQKLPFELPKKKRWFFW